MVISFVWDDKKRIGWDDGLMKALSLLPYKVNVLDYSELNQLGNEDVIMWWSDLTHKQHEVLEKFNKPKILCFAGGGHLEGRAKNWDLIFTESKRDYNAFKEMGINTIRAFGTNMEIFYPEDQPKVFDAIFPASYAGWKRQKLFAEVMGSKGLTCGYIQPENDRDCYYACVEKGVLALPEVKRETLRGLYNASKCTLITSDFNGGSDRAVLESMACNIPVVVMADNTDVLEYVEASGFGEIALPTKEGVREAVNKVINKKWEDEGVEYIGKNWSETIYSNKLEEGIKLCLQKSV